MTTVAVYTPVLNEATHAQRWALSAKDADYLFWLDTGSTDGTVEAAERFGITVMAASIKPFRFDDARNAALALLPGDIDLCLHMDGDEVLEPGWKESLEANPGHGRYTYTLRNGVPTAAAWASASRSNFHARYGYRWVHPIHEVISGPPATAHLDGLVITHRPNGGKDRSYYLQMLRSAVAEDPDSPRMRFYLGRELYFRGEWEEAREVLSDFVKMNGWAVERGEGYRLIAAMDFDPERWLWHSVAECPERREPWVDLAVLYRKEQRDEEAKAMLLIADTKNDPTVYTTEAYAWGDQYNRLMNLVGIG